MPTESEPAAGFVRIRCERSERVPGSRGGSDSAWLWGLYTKVPNGSALTASGCNSLNLGGLRQRSATFLFSCAHHYSSGRLFLGGSGRRQSQVVHATKRAARRGRSGGGAVRRANVEPPPVHASRRRFSVDSSPSFRIRSSRIHRMYVDADIPRSRAVVSTRALRSGFRYTETGR